METGILIGFIFPGDTLLFTAGIMSASADRAIAPLWVLMVLIPVAAALGDQLGYLIGRRYGPPRPCSPGCSTGSVPKPWRRPRPSSTATDR
jgi:membrane protein DedA with SNARE-associated domain